MINSTNTRINAAAYSEEEKGAQRSQQARPQDQPFPAVAAAAQALVVAQHPQQNPMPLRQRNIQTLEDLLIDDSILLPPLLKMVFEYLPLNEQLRVICTFPLPNLSAQAIQKQIDDLQAKKNDNEQCILDKLWNGLLSSEDAVKLLKTSFAVVLAAAKVDWIAVREADRALLIIRENALALVRINGNILRYLEDFQNDADMVVNATEANAEAIEFAKNLERITKEKALAIVRKNGLLLQHLEQYKDDADVCLAAILQNINAIAFAKNLSLITPEHALNIVKANGKLFRYMVRFHNELDILTEVIGQDPTNIYEAPYLLRAYFVFTYIEEALNGHQGAIIWIAKWMKTIYQPLHNQIALGDLRIVIDSNTIWEIILSIKQGNDIDLENIKAIRGYRAYFFYKHNQANPEINREQLALIEEVESKIKVSQDQDQLTFNFLQDPVEKVRVAENYNITMATRLLNFAKQLGDESGLVELELARINLERYERSDDRDKYDLKIKIEDGFEKAFSSGQIVANEELAEFMRSQQTHDDDEDVDDDPTVSIQGNLSPIYQLYLLAAEQYEKAGDLIKARECLVEACDQTYVNVTAHITLGRYLLNGRGGPKDEKEAFRRFHTAVFETKEEQVLNKSNNASSEESEGEVEDKKEKDQGPIYRSLNDGFAYLAESYEIGYGVLQDLKMASKLYKSASEYEGFYAETKNLYRVKAQALGGRSNRPQEPQQQQQRSNEPAAHAQKL